MSSSEKGESSQYSTAESQLTNNRILFHAKHLKTGGYKFGHVKSYLLNSRSELIIKKENYNNLLAASKM